MNAQPVASQGQFVLLNSRPAVAADANDHGGRDSSRNALRMVGTRAIAARMRCCQNARDDGDVTIEARPVDPRDVNISVDAPTFRVYFWRSAPSLACREFEVTGADVDEVIEWAEDNKVAGETYELGVLTPVSGMHDGDVLLTRIKGTDPTCSQGGSGNAATARG